MADKEFLLGNKARDLLKYTNQATKVATSDTDRRDVRRFVKRLSELEDMQDVKVVCTQFINSIDAAERKGFSKSAYRCYGEDMRWIAKEIVRNIHAANGKLFATEYAERLRLIGKVLDLCSLMLEYIQICIELDYVSIKKAEVWTKKVTDVKYMTASWRKNDNARARRLESEYEEQEKERQIELIQTAIRRMNR